MPEQLTQLRHRAAGDLIAAFRRLADAVVRSELGDPEADVHRAELSLAQVIGKTQAAAFLNGSLSLAREVDEAHNPVRV